MARDYYAMVQDILEFAFGYRPVFYTVDPKATWDKIVDYVLRSLDDSEEETIDITDETAETG